MSREPDGRITVELQSASTHHKRRETFDFVIGADGAYSVVRQALGIDRPGKSRTIIAMPAYCTVGYPHKPLSETLRLDFIDALLPLYGWVFPMVGGRANIGIGIPVSILQKRGLNLRDLMTIYTDDLRRRAFEVSELEAVSVRQLPLASAKQAMTTRGWPAALIGDAAALINPLSGEGIFYGMAAGIQLAESIAAARGVDRRIDPRPCPDGS
jgi:menaquinone-9 beta-reductase